MLNKQKQAFRLYCKRHKHLYRIFSQWFERRTNRALRDNRKQWGIDNNLVVFSSYNMRAYNDNPWYISEALHEMRPQTTLVWLFRDVATASGSGRMMPTMDSRSLFSRASFMKDSLSPM